MDEYITLSNDIKIPAVSFGTDMTFIYIRKNIIKGIRDFWVDITQKGGYHFKSCLLYTSPSPRDTR